MDETSDHVHRRISHARRIFVFSSLPNSVTRYIWVEKDILQQDFSFSCRSFTLGNRLFLQPGGAKKTNPVSSNGNFIYGSWTRRIKKSFFKPKARVVARELIGKIISCNDVSGVITETEAYEDDEASHAFKRTERSALMHDSYGRFYIYFIYGNHYCMNITTNEKGPGAVLIRGLKPLNGIELMKRRRKCGDVGNLLNGPGKICQAFGIDKRLWMYGYYDEGTNKIWVNR